MILILKIFIYLLVDFVSIGFLLLFAIGYMDRIVNFSSVDEDEERFEDDQIVFNEAEGSELAPEFVENP